MYATFTLKYLKENTRLQFFLELLVFLSMLWALYFDENVWLKYQSHLDALERDCVTQQHLL
jgi:hypothetical protein